MGGVSCTQYSLDLFNFFNFSKTLRENLKIAYSMHRIGPTYNGPKCPSNAILDSVPFHYHGDYSGFFCRFSSFSK